MNWLQYLAEANLYLAVFYLAYLLILKKDTHYLLSRAYLLFGCMVSFVLPLVQLGFLKPAAPPDAFATILIGGYAMHPAVADLNLVHAHSYFTLQNCLLCAYLAGAATFAILLIIKLNRLLSLTRSHVTVVGGGYKLVRLNDSNTAFSFFNYLFIGTKALDAEIIVRHELVHIRQKHSADIIFLELIKVICWFNPLIYLLQNSLKGVHEYIADEQTAAYSNDALSYSSFLVNNAYGIGGPPVTHSFFNYNLLKQRIIMLHQKPSGSLARLKYLLALPLCAGLLCISTLGFSKTYGFIDLLPKHTAIKTSKPARQTLIDTSKNMPVKGARYKNSGITVKGFKYIETGHVVNNKADFRVLITENDGKETAYVKSSSTRTQIEMLKEKYGYAFPSMDLFTKLPPPPPVPAPPARLHGPKAPKLAPPVVTPVDTSGPAQPAIQSAIQTPPPPMAPYMPLSGPFEGLKKYLGRHVLYPTAEFKKRIMGSAVIKFDINSDHKVANASLVKGFASACDDEALSVVKSFNETIDKAPGTYKLAITFYLHGLKAPEPASSALDGDPSFIGEVVIEMYPN